MARQARGSGQGTRDRKRTVEESLGVAVRDFRGRIFGGAAGTLSWTWARGEQFFAEYFVTWDDLPTITLHYPWQAGEVTQTPFRLQTTPTQFCGERWWFTCPLYVNGVACNRRVGKLFLPPGAKYFGCRHCHGLTYQSCQEAHQTERLFTSIDRLERRSAAMKARQR